MEIAPVPHRSAVGEWRRLTLGLLVLLPMVLLVLLPAALGLDRDVVTDRSSAGAVSRGSIVLTREVLPGDLRAGDVISYRPDGGASDDRVTRRVIAVDDGVATFESAGASGVVRVQLTGSAYDRVWLAVPWIGYPFLLEGGWVLLALAALIASVVAIVAGRKAPQKATRPTRQHLPVG